MDPKDKKIINDLFREMSENVTNNGEAKTSSRFEVLDDNDKEVVVEVSVYEDGVLYNSTRGVSIISAIDTGDGKVAVLVGGKMSLRDIGEMVYMLLGDLEDTVVPSICGELDEEEGH